MPLARALLHAQLPKWFAEESKEGVEPPEMMRFRCTACSARTAPDAELLCAHPPLHPLSRSRAGCHLLCAASFVLHTFQGFLPAAGG